MQRFFGCQQVGIEAVSLGKQSFFPKLGCILYFMTFSLVSSATAWLVWQSWSRRFSAKNGKGDINLLSLSSPGLSVCVWQSYCCVEIRATVFIPQACQNVSALNMPFFFTQGIGIYVLPAAHVFNLPYFHFASHRIIQVSSPVSLLWARRFSLCPKDKWAIDLPSGR